MVTQKIDSVTFISTSSCPGVFYCIQATFVSSLEYILKLARHKSWWIQSEKIGNPVVIPMRANFLCAKKHISPMCPVKRLVRLQLVLLNYTISQWMMSKQTIRSYHFKTVETYYDQGQQSWALATTVATIWHCFKGQHNVTQLQFYSSCETTVFSVVILIMHM